MGAMRFLIHPPEYRDGWPEVHRAYLSGSDGHVFTTQVEFNGTMLTCRRSSSESGKLHVAWPIPGFGRPVLSTASLCEREQPYLLPVELARGLLAMVRDQSGKWEMSKMSVPPEFHFADADAYRFFSQAASAQEDPDKACRLACKSIEAAFRAAETLARSYSEQRLRVRRQRSPRLPASLGCQLGYGVPDAAGEKHFCSAFNAALVPIQWRQIEPVEGEYYWEQNDRQIEWCQSRKLFTYGGPLLDLAPEGLPTWLWQWERDFLNLQSFVCDFVETAVARYFGKIRHWEISARVNTGGALAISEEDRLALVARTLEASRQVDEEIQLLIRVDQPWGGYQARGQHRLSPMQFVDALLRSGVGLSGVNLEVAVGYRPRGSAARGQLDFSRLLDRWSLLGIPIHVTLAFPSATGADAKCRTDLEVGEASWKEPWSENAQADWIDDYLPILMSKDQIVGIYWTHFSDSDPHDFPHAGLLRHDETPKPALARIAHYRREYWQGGEGSGVLK